MFQPYITSIGLRYLRAKRNNQFISFISLISILGIALGITALITIMSVMNGFQIEVRERLLSMTAHASVTKLNAPIKDWQPLLEKAEAHPTVVGAAPYVSAQLMAVNRSQVTGTLMRGVLPELEPKVSDIGNQMVAGSLDDLQPGGFGVIIGTALADYLGVDVGQKVTLITPEANVTTVGVLPRMKRFTVVGLFNVGMYEYDRNLIFMHQRDASVLMRLEGGVTGVRLALEDMFHARSVARDLANDLAEDYWVSDWTQQHSNYFKAVKTEKTIMFMILTLIIAVAAFNIVSTLVMVVNDKRADIAILRTIGASPLEIMGIFLVQGSMIGVLGTVIGAIGGVLLAINVPTVVPFIESLLGRKFLDPSVYAISDIPSQLQTGDVVMVVCMSLGLAIFATLYPAWQAARTQPAEALRYE